MCEYTSMFGGKKSENLKIIMAEAASKEHITQPQELRKKTEWDYGVSLAQLLPHL